MGEQARPKKTSRGLAAGSRLHEAAEAAARAGGMLLRPRGEESPSSAGSPGADGDPRGDALADARLRLREAEDGHARALARAARRWEKERSALEMQMTGLVQEIGAAKHIVERVSELEAEVERLRAELVASEQAARSAEAESARLRIEFESARPGDDAVAAGRNESPTGGRAVHAAVAGASRGTA